LFEETVTGTLASLEADFAARPAIKGEIVVVVEGNLAPPAREPRPGREARNRRPADDADDTDDEDFDGQD
jgi:16S rRNA (cytidine1402-2'-O)-methyltransferase